MRPFHAFLMDLFHPTPLSAQVATLIADQPAHWGPTQAYSLHHHQHHQHHHQQQVLGAHSPKGRAPLQELGPDAVPEGAAAAAGAQHAHRCGRTGMAAGKRHSEGAGLAPCVSLKAG